jgi:transcriptional regulator with XRE-family HTH domain
MSQWREQLREQFKNKEFRESFATEHLNASIALQLTVIREQRGLKQEKLAELAGTKQAGISRLESAEYGRWNVQTLRDIAHLLGCRLRVSLETFGSLLDEAEQLSRSSLERPSFVQDPVFREHSASGLENGSLTADPVQWVRDMLLPYLDRRGPARQMADWLSGRDLPPVGDEQEPYVWLAWALPKGDVKLRNSIIVIIEELLSETYSKPSSGQSRYLVNLLRLTAELGEETFSHAISLKLNSIYEWVCTGHSGWQRAELSALRDAVIRHQTGQERVEQWFNMIDHDRDDILPGTAMDGFRGLCYIPPRPNLELIAEGLKRLEMCYWEELDYPEILHGVSERFAFDVQSQDRLFELSIEKKWGSLLVAAWTKCFVPDQETLQAVKDVIQNDLRQPMEGTAKVMAAGV